MSSWERARFVPWSRIPQGESQDLSLEKERLFRQLQREADQQEKEQQEASKALKNADGMSGLVQTEELQESGLLNSQIKFKWMDLFKNAAFGGTIGSITGSVFGFMDGMRTAQQSEVLMNASNVAKGRYLLQGTTRSATLFGVFFGGFHTLRYGLRVAADPGEWAEIGIAGGISLGALMSQPKFRPSMPYATMLVFMDCVHIVMRHFDN